ncbi:hypothetical protein [Lactiplantibacillus plantarum]|jgi:hypothetical protein|uniref:hypothetical protein n=1 Tax=Lactiplantibacillus plantarum TaxID=1590 RepID=UPI0015EC0277|nr:hypothetical protein [Lactiplantibacillus plantarum]MBA3076673.1 hypothetical protein [Lactiplantibacillus plantarum]MBA3082473.1 hypothetical protein [Lactiplantibacillus plantarum]MDT4758308.1 hypothetical protein [Lactiplantibacillus plantarum]MDY7131327.1 hypothetical protein [Lactiplantibacillus plantarum]
MKHKNKSIFKIDRTNEEMIIQLKNCLDNLSSDAAAYDQGNFQAIRRSSTTLRILFYDSDTSHSILNQIYDKNKFRLLNSFLIDKYDRAYFGGVLFVELPGTVLHPDSINPTFVPDNHIINQASPEISFDNWWTGTIFKSDSNGEKLTRKDLITIMANQDGGAHVDKKVNRTYMDIARGDTGWNINLSNFYTPEYYKKLSPDDEGFIHPKDIQLAMLRKIVHEVLFSLPKQLKLDIDYRPDFMSNLNRRLNPYAFNMHVTDKQAH